MSFLGSIDFKCFSLLLKASSKKQVLETMKDVYSTVNNFYNLEPVVKKCVTNFSITNREANELVTSLSYLIRTILFENYSSSESIASVFPDDVHANLKDLLVKIIIECLPEWRSETISNSVSIPKLIDFNWRVDVKMASDDDKRTNAPSCVLQLKIEENKKMVSEEPPGTKTVNVELSKETLDTMLHGLGRIRDQLTAVANKS